MSLRSRLMKWVGIAVLPWAFSASAFADASIVHDPKITSVLSCVRDLVVGSKYADGDAKRVASQVIYHLVHLRQKDTRSGQEIRDQAVDLHLLNLLCADYLKRWVESEDEGQHMKRVKKLSDSGYKKSFHSFVAGKFEKVEVSKDMRKDFLDRFHGQIENPTFLQNVYDVANSYLNIAYSRLWGCWIGAKEASLIVGIGYRYNKVRVACQSALGGNYRGKQSSHEFALGIGLSGFYFPQSPNVMIVSEERMNNFNIGTTHAPRFESLAVKGAGVEASLKLAMGKFSYYSFRTEPKSDGTGWDGTETPGKGSYIGPVIQVQSAHPFSTSAQFSDGDQLIRQAANDYSHGPFYRDFGFALYKLGLDR